jgi:Domain of unknown function (DUF4440)
MNIDTDKKGLQTLNEEIATRESQRDAAAKKWFGDLLSEHLIFRRADTTVIDKTGFLKGLGKPDPFNFREAEDINATVMGDRALVVLTVCTRKEGGTENRYRNVRLFSRSGENWVMELWYNYQIPSQAPGSQNSQPDRP